MKNNNLRIKEYFSNNFVIDRNIFIINKDDKYTDNFSNQWKDFNYVQVDSFNKTKISEDYLRDLLFNDLNQLKQLLVWINYDAEHDNSSIFTGKSNMNI